MKQFVYRSVQVSGIFFLCLLAFIYSLSFQVGATHTMATIPAFPGAEGVAANTKGGRGGKVFIVSNLNDSGAGSLRECVIATGPRICVFNVAGTIELNSALTISNPYITIAGQAAPGGGITLKAAPGKLIDPIDVKTYEVIIRYIRSRPGTKEQSARALSASAGSYCEHTHVLPTDNPRYGEFSYAIDSAQAIAAAEACEPRVHNVIVDHSSFSWAGDELTIAWYATRNITLSWNIYAESLPPGQKGPSMGKWENGGPYSFHHNLLAHHKFRNPNISAGGGVTDVVNNVIYNFYNKGAAVKLGARVNIVNNYIKAGPNTAANAYYVDDQLDDMDPDFNNPNILNGVHELSNPDTRGYYVSPGNVVEGSYNGSPKILDVIQTSGSGAVPAKYIKGSRYDTVQVPTTDAIAARDQVLASAGNSQGVGCNGDWFSRRDVADTRIVQSVQNQTNGHNIPKTNTYLGVGYINSPADVAGSGTDAAGWPILAAGTPCLNNTGDTDRDGMPDDWESRYAINATAPTTANPNALTSNSDTDGYTDIEEYLNGTNPKVADGTIVPTLIPTTPVSPTNTSTPVSPTVTKTSTPTSAPSSVTYDGILANFLKTATGLVEDLNPDQKINAMDFIKLVLNKIIPTTSQHSGLMTNFTTKSSITYPVGSGLQTGDKAYTDQTITYNSLPSFLLGGYYVQTSNNDRANTSTGFITFSLADDASVYVLYDSRNPIVPSWLTITFTKRTETVTIEGITYDLYKRNYSLGGNVSVGGNSNSSNNMYTVIVTSR